MKQRFSINILVDTENEKPVTVIDIDEAVHDTIEFEDFVVHPDRGKQADVGCIVGVLVEEVTPEVTIRESAGIVHQRFIGKETIWLVGIGQGIIYIYSHKAVSENTKCMILAQCFPVGVSFVVVGHPIEEFLEQLEE